MVVDKILRDIQLKLIDLANEIQRQREFRLKATGTRKEKKEHGGMAFTERFSFFKFLN